MKIKNINKLFFLPVLIGVFFALIDHLLINNITAYNNPIIVTILYTISSNITALFKWLAPFITLFLITSSIKNLRGNTKKFFNRYFMILITSLLALSIITFTFGMKVVVLFPDKLITEVGSSNYIDSLFTIELSQIFNVFTAIVLGILIGNFMKKDGYISKVMEEGEELIYVILKKVVFPLMPIWILGTFASTAFSMGGINIILYDLFLSLIVLFIQFLWLFIMYVISSKYSKISLKKILKSAAKIYGLVVSMSGNTSGVIVPIIVKEQKSLGIDENKAKFITSASFNMPGSLVSNIIFMIGTVQMFDIQISLQSYLMYIIALNIVLIVSPSISGGVWTLTSTILNPILGFNNDMVTQMGAFYFKQGISNAAVNNCGDFYLGALTKEKDKS